MDYNSPLKAVLTDYYFIAALVLFFLGFFVKKRTDHRRSKIGGMLSPFGRSGRLAFFRPIHHYLSTTQGVVVYETLKEIFRSLQQVSWL